MLRESWNHGIRQGVQMVVTKSKWKERTLATVFLGPSTFFFLLVIAVPFLSGIYYSFTSWNGVQSKAIWTGLSNFRYLLLQDSQFLESFWFTFRFTLTTLVITNVVAFLFAMALVQPLRFRGALRTVFFLPCNRRGPIGVCLAVHSGKRVRNPGGAHFYQIVPAALVGFP